MRGCVLPVRRLCNPPLEESAILAWADAYHARTGTWPKLTSGPIPETDGETWARVDKALRGGYRGLLPDSSLALLLAKHRGVRNDNALPNFSIDAILAWVDAHHSRMDTWPKPRSGSIPDAPGETWARVETALLVGLRGLAGGSSLARLLAEHRGLRNPQGLPPLTEETILLWADAHYARMGQWPTLRAGNVAEAPGETWMGVNGALALGQRGLPGSSSLARLLHAHRGRRTQPLLRQLTIAEVTAWARACQLQTGRWPRRGEGAIVEAAGETWLAVDAALRTGSRSLPGGSSLAKLRREAEASDKGRG